MIVSAERKAAAIVIYSPLQKEWRNSKGYRGTDANRSGMNKSHGQSTSEVRHKGVGLITHQQPDSMMANMNRDLTTASVDPNAMPKAAPKAARWNTRASVKILARKADGWATHISRP